MMREIKTIYKINYKHLIYILPVLFTVLLSRTVYFGIVHYQFYQVIFWLFSIACGIVFKIKVGNFKRMLNVFIPIAVFIIINIIVTMAFPSIISYVITLINIFCCGFISIYIPKEYISKYYIYIIFAFCLISIPCFFVLSQFPNIALRLCQSGYNYQSRFGYSWYFTFGWNGGLLYRNSGPFWEPGAFQGFIVIAIIMLLYNTDKYTVSHRKIVLLTFLITLLTTQSTTGYIILVLLAITCFKQIKDTFYSTSNKAFKRFMTAAIVLTLIYIVVTSGNIGDKFSGLYENNRSANIRSNDFFSGIQMTLKGGVFGLGCTNQREFYKAYYGITDDSCGLTHLFYTYGIAFGLLYAYFAVKGITNFFECNSKIRNASILLIFLILFLTEDLCFLPVYIIIIFSGFQKTNNKNVDLHKME